MMKKKLFLLFSFYFFVLQPVFLWLLRSEINFIYLSAINCVFIVLIALLTKGSKDSVDHDKIIFEETKQFHYIQKDENHKPVSHVRFFVISILFGLFVWFSLGSMIFYLQLFIVVLGSFLLFILFGLLFKFKIFKVWESKLYLFVIFIILIRSIFEIFNINIKNIFDKSTNENQNNSISNFVDISDDLEIADDILSLLPDVADEQKDLEVRATFQDVIKYLVDKNDLKINTNKNIKFDYISYNDEDYNYYRTVYDLGLIGKNLNPSKNLFCETYVVMLGLVEKWNVGSYSDIKQAYWKYASDNDKLPDCQYGEFIMIKNFYK